MMGGGVRIGRMGVRMNKGRDGKGMEEGVKMILKEMIEE